jgi:hypothetical protein
MGRGGEKGTESHLSDVMSSRLRCIDIWKVSLAEETLVQPPQYCEMNTRTVSVPIKRNAVGCADKLK